MKILLVVLMSVVSFNTYAVKDEKKELQRLEKSLIEQDRQILSLKRENIQQERIIRCLSDKQEMNMNRIDSLISEFKGKSDIFEKGLIDAKKQMDDNAKASYEKISDRTIAGIIIGCILFVVTLLVYLILYKRINYKTSSIEDVQKVQEKLKNAQIALEEESVKLDNKLLEIAEKQLNTVQSAIKTTGTQNEPDHSLVIKLADEIARIETNLAKMDKKVRGYKQLVQAKDRMINNVRAYGYEIISLIGQDYNDGMPFYARFVPDDNLPEGKRVITGMIKMQVNYNGKMIQPAQIVVSQNI